MGILLDPQIVNIAGSICFAVGAILMVAVALGSFGRTPAKWQR
jgi:hypothetical protein